MGKHRRLVKAGLIAGCVTLWAAGFSAPAFRGVPRETRGDLLFVALFASLALLFWPLRRRVRDIEEGIEDIYERVQLLKRGEPVLRAVGEPESGAS